MRVFARTARPIGGVQVLTPLLFRDYTAATNPVWVEVNAILVDDQKQALCGSAPLRIEVIDALGAKRFDLYRATNRGLLRLTLPLAANDPAGKWIVRVRELLSDFQGQASFRYKPAQQCAALAGATRRAVLFGSDRDNIFRFFRTHKDLTIVKGSSKFHDAAARRLTQSLAPWDIRCKTIAAADVKRRVPTVEEKPTWVDAGGAFDLRGPVVLLGNPDDNPLIRHLRDQKYLPYAPVRDEFPGRGRGMLAWQRDGLAYFGHESLTLIAHDEAGLDEAVGSAYEIVAGLEPLTPLVLPEKAAIRAATRAAQAVPGAAVAWRRTLPDRAVAMRTLKDGVIVLAADGTLCLFKTGGQVAWRKTLPGGEAWSLDVSRNGRLIAVGGAHRFHAFDAKGKLLFDRAPDLSGKKELSRSEGISLVAVAADASRVLVGSGSYTLSQGTWQFHSTLSLYGARGDKLWSVGGLNEKTRKPRIAERLRSGFFSPNGKQIIVVTEKKIQVIDAATGAFGKSVAGMVCTSLGENLLVSDGDSKLILYSPGGDKVLGQLDFARAGPVVLVPTDQGILVGTEADGTVRLVKTIAGKLEDQTVWKNQMYTKVVKQVTAHGKRVAISYWGGTLRLFDANGKLQAEQVYSQDISALAWTDRGLVVGMADGKVVGLK
jgi:hypothetical protein